MSHYFQGAPSLSQTGIIDRMAKSTPGISPQTCDEEERLYTFYLDVVLNQNIEVPKVQVLLPITLRLEKAVEMALEEFEKDLAGEFVRVDQDPDSFLPRQARKSGRCRLDVSCLDKSKRLCEFSTTTISLQLLDQNSVSIDHSQSRKECVSMDGINNEINYNKREEREVSSLEGEKEESTCFHSVC